MMRLILTILFMSVLLQWSGCSSVRVATLKNACSIEELGEDFEHLSDEELKHWALKIEALPTSKEQGGCRAAQLARIYAKLERHNDARVSYTTAAEKLPKLKPELLLEKAKVALKNNQIDEALLIGELLTKLREPLSKNTKLRLNILKAEIAVKQKNDVAIIKTHRDLTKMGHEENATSLYNLGQALLRQGQMQEALAINQKLLINFPSSDEAKSLLEQNDLLSFGLNIKDLEKRFDKLIAKLAFDQAKSDAENLSKLELSDEDKSQIESFAIKALVHNRQYAEAFAKAKKLATRPSASPKDLESYAWTLAKTNRAIEAAEIYSRLINSPDQDLSAKGCFFKGFSYYEANIYTAALASWQSCETQLKPSSYYENSLWYQAFSLLLSEQYAKAAKLLKRLNQEFAKSKEQEKYQYFLALTQSLRRETQKSREIMLKLAQKNEPSYFVLLARESLNLHRPKALAVSSPKLCCANLKDPHEAIDHARLLYHLGFKNDARDLILSSPLETAAKFAELHHLNFFHEVWQRAHLLNPSAVIQNSKLIFSPHIRARYPKPYAHVVAQLSDRYQVDPHLLYAIMQAESGFHRQALSVRGARGTMQMMPFVAEELAPHSSRSKFHEDDLENPKIAIELGAMLLAQLSRQFHKPHLIAAAYNAGADHVQAWLDQFGHLPDDIFTERMPYLQTRNYVHEVLKNRSLRRAFDGESLSLDSAAL